MSVKMERHSLNFIMTKKVTSDNIPAADSADRKRTNTKSTEE